MSGQIPVAALDDEGLRARLVALERVVNMAQAEQAALMSEMTRRAGIAEAEFVSDEIAVVLHTSKPVASSRLGLALAAAATPQVHRAWSSGAIDSHKVRVICEGLACASPIALSTLTDAAVDYAITHTTSELRRWLRRRVVATDPDTADRLHQAASAERRLTLMPLPEGMSELVARLPSIQARQLYNTANAVAYAQPKSDARTMDQRRADAFVDLVIGRAAPPQVTFNVVVPLDTYLGRQGGPATVDGIGPVTASELKQLSRDPVVRRLLTDPMNGRLLDVAEKHYRPSSALERLVRLRDMVCRFPGCSRPATTPNSGTDLDHAEPWPQGPTSAGNLNVLCRHHHRLKHSPRWSVIHHDDGVLEWRTPWGGRFRTEPWVYDDSG